VRNLFNGSKLNISELVKAIGDMADKVDKIEGIDEKLSNILYMLEVKDEGTTSVSVEDTGTPAVVDFETLLHDHLVFEENCILHVHDVDGKPHIGYGRSLITKGLSDNELDKLGYEDEDDIEEITQEQADYLFRNDIADAIDETKDVCQYWEKLSDVRKVVCVSLAYNTGKTGFSKFRRMHLNASNGDWEGAAKEILDSKAFKFGLPGVKARYQRLSDAMATNDISKFQLKE